MPAILPNALPMTHTPHAPDSTSSLQWKLIYLARRNPALAAADFPQAWREHAALGRQCRNVQDKVLGVAQCSRLRDMDEFGGLRGTNADYDGVNLLQLRDLAVATDIWDDPETRAIMRPDEPRVFSSYVREFSLACAEHVLRQAPPTSVVLFGFLRRAPTMSTAEFHTAWATHTSDRWLAAPSLNAAQRVVHNTVVQPPPTGYEFDGIAEWWFADADAARQAMGSDNVSQQLPRAYGDLVNLDQSVFMFTHVTHRRP